MFVAYRALKVDEFNNTTLIRSTNTILKVGLLQGQYGRLAHVPTGWSIFNYIMKLF